MSIVSESGHGDPALVSLIWRRAARACAVIYKSMYCVREIVLLTLYHAQ